MAGHSRWRTLQAKRLAETGDVREHPEYEQAGRDAGGGSAQSDPQEPEPYPERSGRASGNQPARPVAHRARWRHA